MVKDQIKADIMAAMKAKDSAKTQALRYLVSLIDKKALQLPPEAMNEAEEIKVLQKELKNKQEAREMFFNANRQDLVNDLDFEIQLLNAYLPQALSNDDLEKLVSEAIAKTGNNFGMVMREVISQAGGRASGDEISQMVKKKLSE